MPIPQIRRNLTPRQTAGLRDANCIPLELASRVSLPYPSDAWSDPKWRVLLPKDRNETGTGPMQGEDNVSVLALPSVVKFPRRTTILS